MSINSIGVHNLSFASGSHFDFKIDNFPDLNFTIQSANLPGVSTSPREVPTPVGPTYHAGDKLYYEILDINFIVDESLQNWLSVYNWMRALAPTHVIDAEAKSQYDLWKEEKDLYSTAVLYILTNSLNWNLKVTLHNIFPISLTGLPYRITNQEDEKIYSTVKFAFDYYDVEVNPNYNTLSVANNVIS